MHIFVILSQFVVSYLDSLATAIANMVVFRSHMNVLRFFLNDTSSQNYPPASSVTLSIFRSLKTN